MNKDVGPERWAITLNRDDGTATGNVFFPGGGEPAFIFCEPLPSPNAFSCFGAGPCTDGPCTEQYQFIGNITIPFDFFEPPLAQSLTAQSDGVGDATIAGVANLQRGIQLTPGGKRVLVNKDVGAERWAITLNRDDGTATGNVFVPGGGEPAFIFCEPLPSPNAFSCFGAGPCVTRQCVRSVRVHRRCRPPSGFLRPRL